MRSLLTCLISVLLISTVFGQSWNFKATGNDFDGRIRTASIDGKGGEYPYTTPTLVVNYFENSKSLNFYITDMGYTGCDDNQAFFVIDGTHRLKTQYVSDDSEKSTLFFDGFDKINSGEYGTFSNLEVLQLLKSGTKLSVRVSNDCYQRDYSFSLTGSTAAINFVLGRDFDEAIKLELKVKQETAAANSMSDKIKILDSTLTIDAKTKAEVLRVVSEEMKETSTPLSDILEIQIVKSDWSPGTWQIEIIVWFDETKTKTYAKKVIYPSLLKLGNELIIL